jgi:hypothetical protein
LVQHPAERTCTSVGMIRRPRVLVPERVSSTSTALISYSMCHD